MGQDICNDTSGSGGLVAKPRPIHAPPWTVACQAPLSMGFSRWQYCRGLPSDPGIKPGSSAMQADSLLTEPWGTYPIKGYYPKYAKNSYSSVSRSIMSDSLRPHSLSPTSSSVHGILQARILEWTAIPFFRGSSQPRDQTWVSCIAGRFFTVWATGKILRTHITQY